MMNLLQHTRQLSVRSLMGGPVSSRRTSVTTDQIPTDKKSNRKRRPKSSSAAAAATMANSSTQLHGNHVDVSSADSSAETEKTTSLELSQSFTTNCNQQEQPERKKLHKKLRSRKNLVDRSSTSTSRHRHSRRRPQSSEEQELPKQPRHGMLGNSSRSHRALHDPNASSRTLLSLKQEKSRRNIRKGLESSSDLIASMWTSHQELPLMENREEQPKRNRQKGPPVTARGRRGGLSKALSVPALVPAAASVPDVPNLPPSTSHKKVITSSTKKAKPKATNTFMSRLRDELVQPLPKQATRPHQNGTTSLSREKNVTETVHWSRLVHVPTNPRVCSVENHRGTVHEATTPPRSENPHLQTTEDDNNHNAVSNVVNSKKAAAAEKEPHPVEEMQLHRATESVGHNHKGDQAAKEPRTIMAPPDNSLFCIGLVIEVPADFDGSDV